jgi:hypothetical protein
VEKSFWKPNENSGFLMAAPKSSLTARLQKLDAAKARADNVPRGTRLSAKPMAEMLGVTWISLKDWCNEIAKLESSGAVVRGGNGVEWSFEPKRTVKILIEHFKGVQTRQAAKSREVAASVGVTLPEGEAPSLSETKDMVNLTLSVTKAAGEQGQYVLAEDMMRFLIGYNQRVLDGILGVRTQVDPNGSLPAHVRSSIDGYLRQLATTVHGEAARFIGEFQGENLQQGATG